MTSAHPRPPVSQGKASYATSTHRREGDRDATRAYPPPKHLLHRSRSVGPAAASEVALSGECLGYLPQRLPLSVQLAHQRDDFRNLLSVCGTGTALAPRLALDAGKPLEMLLGAAPEKRPRSRGLHCTAFVAPGRTVSAGGGRTACRHRPPKGDGTILAALLRRPREPD